MSGEFKELREALAADWSPGADRRYTLAAVNAAPDLLAALDAAEARARLIPAWQDTAAMLRLWMLGMNLSMAGALAACDEARACRCDVPCALCRQERATLTAERDAARAEAERMRAALETISRWDMLSLDDEELRTRCEDLPWLRRLVRAALAGSVTP